MLCKSDKRFIIIIIIITDHNPLTHLQEQPSLSRRQARWMEYLARFDYDWKYRPGHLNVIIKLVVIRHWVRYLYLTPLLLKLC